MNIRAYHLDCDQSRLLNLYVHPWAVEVAGTFTQYQMQFLPEPAFLDLNVGHILNKRWLAARSLADEPFRFSFISLLK